MEPYAGVDYNLTLCRLQHIYHRKPYARVDLNPMPESILSPSQSVYLKRSIISMLYFEWLQSKNFYSLDCRQPSSSVWQHNLHHLEEILVRLNYHCVKGKWKTHMVEEWEPSLAKQLYLNHVCKIGLRLKLPLQRKRVCPGGLHLLQISMCKSLQKSCRAMQYLRISLATHSTCIKL